MIEASRLREYKHLDELKAKQLKVDQANENMDRMHHKCVLYQDLFHAIITIFVDLLTNTNCFSTAQKETIT